MDCFINGQYILYNIYYTILSTTDSVILMFFFHQKRMILFWWFSSCGWPLTVNRLECCLVVNRCETEIWNWTTVVSLAATFRVVMKSKKRCMRTLMMAVNCKSTSVFHVSILLLIMNFAITLSKLLTGSTDYFDKLFYDQIHCL